jgi:tetraacyldisaccharide 4'-kinase
VPLYRLAAGVRSFFLESGLEPVRRLRFPVVSIGNLSAGGAGKTPLTIELAQTLARHGLQVDVLSRGYGRAGKRAARVDPDGTAEEFGDEPLLMAREARVPVYVATERYEAGLLAEQESGALRGHDFSRASGEPEEGGALAPEGNLHAVHLLDDGFQHRQLHRAIDILLVCRQDMEDRLLPAGNLREPLSAIERAQAIAIPENEPELEAELKALGWQGVVWRIRRSMEVPAIAGPVIAF